MKRYQLQALLIGTVACVPTIAPCAPPYACSDGIVIAESSGCAEEVLFGRLLVTDVSIGAFVLQGHDGEFFAPPAVDVSAFDGLLVRIDFDDQCAVRTILQAERLEGPTIET